MSKPKPILLQRLDRVKELPSLPEVIVKLQAVLSDPNSSARDVASVIETDPPMAAKLLKLANSAYYRAGDNEIASIPQAVTRLGLKEISKSCLALAVLRMFQQKPSTIDRQAFWRHSLTVACATRSVAELSADVIIDPDEAFVAGLLHEIGALVLDEYFGRLYALVHQEAKRTKRAIHLVERESLKVSHADVGAYLLERWNLPDRLVQATRYHHDPSQAPEEDRTLCQLVHLSDFACTRNGLAGPGEEPLATASVRAWNELGLETVNFLELLDRVGAEAERSEIFLSTSAA